MWQSVVSLFAGMPEHAIFMAVAFAGHGIPYLIGTVFPLLCDLNGWFASSKITSERGMAEPALLKRALRDAAISHLLLNPFALYFAYYPFKAMGFHADAAYPSFVTIVLSLLFCAAVNETGFYWAHRLLHSKALYARFHKHHHEFKVTNGLAAEYATPVEHLLSNLIPTLAGPLLLGSHALVLGLWLALRMWESLEGHSGYVFAWSPLNVLEISEKHAFHHMANKGNFGSFGGFWDMVMHTDEAYLRARLG